MFSSQRNYAAIFQQCGRMKCGNENIVHLLCPVLSARTLGSDEDAFLAWNTHHTGQNLDILCSGISGWLVSRFPGHKSYRSGGLGSMRHWKESFCVNSNFIWIEAFHTLRNWKLIAAKNTREWKRFCDTRFM